MAHACSADYGQNAIPVTQCVSQPAHNDNANALAPDIAIRLFVKGLAPPVWRQHPGGRKGNMQVFIRHGVDPTRHDHVTDPAAQVFHPAVQGDQTAGACRFTRFAWPVQIQHMANAV